MPLTMRGNKRNQQSCPPLYTLKSELEILQSHLGCSIVRENHPAFGQVKREG